MEESLTKLTLSIDGMMCGMCEAHINDAIRKRFPDVRKVHSSHAKGEAVIITPHDPGDEELKETIDSTGYVLRGIKREAFQKRRGIFGRTK
ncbi:MAG: heavy-metal-associated domain-containing protein [Oscillospiraceae bacterium]|jgi:copper chaperone